MPRINPFRPNSPISPGMFVGRIEEIRRIEQHLIQTRAGQPTNFIITGERGIGKTSLLNYVKWTAEGSIPIGTVNAKFLVIDTDIEDSTTQLGLIKKIELGLRNRLAKTEKARTFLKATWEFLNRVEAAGFKLNQADAKLDETIFEEFSYSLAAVAERICDRAESPPMFNATYDGILILIDEADNSARTLRLGLFLKLLSERLNRRGCTKVMMGLAGLDTIHHVLQQSHASSLRLFDTTILKRLSKVEVSRVIDMCLQEAKKQNGEETTIAEAGRQLLIHLSEGYPHFIQQFGYSAFEQDSDNVISEIDVTGGAIGEGGALEQIGDRYYRDDFYNRIQKESYRQVLRIMADRLDDWIRKTEIAKRYKGKATVLNNAIKALRDRHIIISKEGEKGVYRLRQKGFALWIKMFTSDPQDLQIALDGAAHETREIDAPIDAASSEQSSKPIGSEGATSETGEAVT